MGLSKSRRKDLVWKPLLRMFRRYLKKDALMLESYDGIRSESIRDQGRLFCKALGLSEELTGSLRNQLAVLLMISSHRVVWRKTLIFECKLLMQPYISDIWPIFFKIFSETSHKLRLRFFADPLIHVLWNKFRVEKAYEINDYLV
jgi:hypothetical protein